MLSMGDHGPIAERTLPRFVSIRINRLTFEYRAAVTTTIRLLGFIRALGNEVSDWKEYDSLGDSYQALRLDADCLVGAARADYVCERNLQGASALGLLPLVIKPEALL